MLKLFRPPYGLHDRRVRRIAGELGYRYTVMWNVQPHDWSSKTTAEQIVDRATGARRGSIILLHCRYASTVKALPRIIRHYQSREHQAGRARRAARPSQPSSSRPRSTAASRLIAEPSAQARSISFYVSSPLSWSVRAFSTPKDSERPAAAVRLPKCTRGARRA